MSETFVAPDLFGGPTDTTALMERVCEWRNMARALRQVISNEGAPGVDGMKVAQLESYVRRHQAKLREALLTGAYLPFPVRRKEIPKPNGGVRLLGIPTVLDRLVQQMLVQVLSPFWECSFSAFSFGFRPHRSQHDAIRQAQQFIEAGYRHSVDLDLEKFFDRVHHDRLMSRLAQRIQDKRVLGLIRRFLSGGVMTGGLESPTKEGVPQGGPLSPLLSNVVLDELDTELIERGLKFVRYADDVVIFVKSERAGERVLASTTRFIKRKLRLRVNAAKSKVTRPWWSTLLGFSFIGGRGAKVRISVPSDTLGKFRERVRELTWLRRGRGYVQVLRELNQFLRGWWGYFRIAETKSFVDQLNGWVRRRLRALIWKHWKTRRKRVTELLKRGVVFSWAMRVGCSRKGPWRMSKNPSVRQALPNQFFARSGLFLMG